MRTGIGYDIHRLVAGRPLVLGGVTIPWETGPLGHSDGDVLLHAIIDAMLGAAGQGDIGKHFPPSDARWKDRSSLALLARTTELVFGLGFRVQNLDATVVLEQPKLQPHIPAMRSAIATALRVGDELVNIKAKTNEGLDAVGRGEAVAAHAIVLLAPALADPASP